jgi:hypothetical protein
VTRLEPIPDDHSPVGAVPIRQWLRDFDIRIRDHTEILADADDAASDRRRPRPDDGTHDLAAWPRSTC